MDALELIKQRRSIRRYKSEKVDHDLMREIIELSSFAPSWANFQVARYTIVDDPELIAQMAEAAMLDFSYNINTLKNTPGVVVLSYVQGKSGKLYEKGYATSKGSGWEVFDAGIACQTFCLAAHAKGVGTCIFGVFDDAIIARLVDLPSDQTVAAVITYGYPEGAHPEPTPRKSVEEISRFL